MRKKILYLIAETGGGHRAAATALMSAVEHERGGVYDQQMVDVFGECSNFLNIFAGMYGPVINHYPQLWGRLFYWFDDESRLEQLKLVVVPLILSELENLLEQKAPDVIVSVHPLVNYLTMRAIQALGKKIPFIIMVTDPVTLHRAWVFNEKDLLPDLVIVVTEEAKKLAIEYGIPENRLKVIGMPVDPKFILKREEKEAARTKNNLSPKLFTILLMGGGEGAGGIHRIVEEFYRQKVEAQLVVIAGKNARLKRKLEKDAENFSMPVKVFGFTDKVHELMAESDLLITKAGPGTIFEALTMNLPIIITSWLPGQEEGNVEFVVRENVGRVCRDPETIVKIVKEIKETNEIEEMKKNIIRVSRPHAAIEIVHEIFNYL